MGILGIVEAQGPEKHVPRKGRLDKFAVEIGQQAVTDTDDPGHGLMFCEAVDLLETVAQGAVVAHQRREHPQLKPPQQEIFGGIAAEAAQIRPSEQEPAHIG